MISSFLKRSRALDEVVQVHVAELVDLLPAVVGRDEAHLRDQDLRLEDGRVGVEAGRAGVAGVGRAAACALLARHLDAGQPQVADLVAGQAVVLRPSACCAAPRRRSRRDGIVCVVANARDDVLARQLDLVARPRRRCSSHVCRPRSSRCMIMSSVLDSPRPRARADRSSAAPSSSSAAGRRRPAGRRCGRGACA